MTSQYTISLYYVVYFGFVMFYTGSNINDLTSILFFTIKNSSIIKIEGEPKQT
jgi:hypothetical protein